MAKMTTQEETREQNMAQVASKTEQFFDKNGKIIYTCAAVVVLLAAAIFCWNKFYLQPKKAEAAAQLFPAEQWFADGNYELALKGDDNNPGLEDIIAQYGKKAGKAVYLYAGVSALEQGNFNDAISYLKKYDGKDNILLGRAQACIGDAYVGLEDYSSALSWFEKAAATSDNMFSASYLVKAAAVCEKTGDKAKALSLYKKVKDQYPQAPEAMDIDKYITRIELAK
ncbi:MAG: hypothetical protein II560_02385 [Bacteroidales bacterium]|nr:hypothetical protein [Bacteroidales bacterium]